LSSRRTSEPDLGDGEFLIPAPKQLAAARLLPNAEILPDFPPVARKPQVAAVKVPENPAKKLPPAVAVADARDGEFLPVKSVAAAKKKPDLVAKKSEVAKAAEPIKARPVTAKATAKPVEVAHAAPPKESAKHAEKPEQAVFTTGAVFLP